MTMTMTNTLDIPALGASPVPELARLQARHKQIVDMQLGGMRSVDIARELGMTPGGVARIIKSPLFQDNLARRREVMDNAMVEASACVVTRAKEQLERSAEDAVGVLTGLLSAESENTRLRSAEAILDRTLGMRDDRSAGPRVVIGELNFQAIQIALRETAGGRDEGGEGGEPADVLDVEVVTDGE